MHPGMRFDLDRLPTDPVLLHKMVREMAEVMGITQDRLNASEATVKALKLHIEMVEHRLRVCCASNMVGARKSRTSRSCA